MARICQLSPLQRQKLRLAGRGDIKRFFEKVEEKSKAFDKLRNDQNKLGELYQETIPLQAMLRVGLYGDGSMYAKTLNRLVNPEQERRYREALETRQRHLYRAKVELAVAQLDQTMSFTDEQRRGLTDLILKETTPAKHFGQYAYYVVLYQASKIPRSKLKPLFDPRQWTILDRTLTQLRLMEQFLRSQGLLPDHSDSPEVVPDFVEALKEPAAATEEAGASGKVSTNGRETSEPAKPEATATVKDQLKGGSAMSFGPYPKSFPVWRTGMLAVAIGVSLFSLPALAQLPGTKFGEVVPRDVREMYDRGLQYLAAKQNDKGEWPGGAMKMVLAPLAWAFWRSWPRARIRITALYSVHVRRSLRYLISNQDSNTGIMGQSMYHHGFAMLALAEAYGAVDEQTLWTDRKGPRTIGQALELAVRAAITSQKKNSFGGWRYSPDANDADTSVSGAVLVGLLSARNAGIEVTDESIDKAITYYKQMTAPSGQVAYTSGMGGFDESIARISIATLIYAVGRRKDLAEYRATLGYLKQRIEQQAQPQWLEYGRYYQAQALFQGDLDSWDRWNKLLIRQLKQSQTADGSFRGQFGASLTTSFSLLALALNYRFLPIYER